jgi:hypothetical protein
MAINYYPYNMMMEGGSNFYESNPYSINNMIGNVSNYTQTPTTSSTSSTVTAAPVQTSGPTNEQPWSPQFLNIPGVGSVPYFRVSDLNWGPYQDKDVNSALKAWNDFTNYYSNISEQGIPWNEVTGYTLNIPSNVTSTLAPVNNQQITASSFYNTEGGMVSPESIYVRPDLKFRGNPADYGEGVANLFRHAGNSLIIPDANDPNKMSFMIKTGGKEGTVIPYARQGDTWVPQTQGIYKTNWDTNDNSGLWHLASVLTLPLLFGGLSSAGLLGTGEAAAGAGETLGTGVAESFPVTMPSAPIMSELPPLTEIGAGGAGAAAGAIDPWFTEPGFAPPVDNPIVTIDDPWVTEPGFEPPIQGSPEIPDPWTTEPGFEPPVTSNPTTPGVGDILRRIGQVGNIAGRLFGGTGGGNQMNNVGGNANGLLGLLSAIYGARQSKEYAEMLRQIAGQMQEQASPYINKLRESYENPNAYLQSPEMQAILSLEANRLAGIDASQGRLSNDINRTAKLQQLAQSRLADYRRGLQQSIERMYQPMAVASLFREAAGRQANAWQGIPQFFGAGGSVDNVWNDIRNVINTGKDIWDVISGWWD